MLLAEKLAGLRREKNESLQDVATAVGASKAHIWEVETGRTQNPSIDLIRRLADHFRVSVAWLVGEAPMQGRSEAEFASLYRALNELSPPDRQVIQNIIETMRKSRQ